MVKKVESNVQSKGSVLGTYTGKCCDYNVLNNNEMHLSRKLFEFLMDSEEYKRAMEYYHYIGFLGHPVDCDCQDYEHACIVMKDMRLLDNGQIEGDFDLVDTPVGRIVKAFIDAGVKFGISIRGLGDVDGNGEVDPETFIFRGFDLVTFPAYDDCIPEFKAIAASTDIEKQAKLKKVYASIDANLDGISDITTLKLIEDQLPDNSEYFNKVDDRIKALEVVNVSDKVENEECDDIVAVLNQKIDAVMNLYLEAQNKVRELESALAEAQTCNITLEGEIFASKHNKTPLDRLVANQIKCANEKVRTYKKKWINASTEIEELKTDILNTENDLSSIKASLLATKKEVKNYIKANKELKSQVEELTNINESHKNIIESSKNTNLKYRHKVEASSKLLDEKDSTIQELTDKLNETVIASKQFEDSASNLDAENKELLSRVTAAEDMIGQYQQAYANIYANALGVYLKGLPITASTSVQELTDMIKAGTSTANIPTSVSVTDDAEEYEDDDIDTFDDAQYSAEMVTL